MDKRIKYSDRQKELVVRSILTGSKSITSATRELGCMKSAVKRWLAQYQQFGIKGFSMRNGRYDGKFKLHVIRHYLKSRLSLHHTASLFKIPNESVIMCWLKIYDRLGAGGLLKENRDRKKITMAKKPPKKGSPPADPATEKLIALQKEVEYLRAENAFLKKLEALVQQEKDAAAQAKRQKPSRN